MKASTRAHLPGKDFAGPNRSFPENDAKHDRLAIAGATRSERAGNISASEANHIKSEARAKLGDSHVQGGAQRVGGHPSHVKYR